MLIFEKRREFAETDMPLVFRPIEPFIDRVGFVIRLQPFKECGSMA